MISCVTPAGTITACVVGAATPPSSSGDGRARWATDECLIELTVAQPHYEGVRFDVEGHIAWLWEITMTRDADLLQIATTLAPHAASACDPRPLTDRWLLGVEWNGDGMTTAIATADLDACMVRYSDEGLPERFLAEDPTRPGRPRFIDDTASGLTATFAGVTAGERFIHHGVVAWAPPSDRAALLDALEVDPSGIRAGLALTDER